MNDKGETILTRGDALDRQVAGMAQRKSKGVFGAVVRDNDMAPVIRPGDRLILNPAGIPQPGSRIMLTRRSDGVFRIREYVDETASTFGS